MATEGIVHQMQDWSKIDETESFWRNIDLLNADDNFGIHRYKNDLWTSGQVGVGRIFDKNHKPIHNHGREHIVLITSSYGLDPWKMLETVMLDDEYEVYMAQLAERKRFLFRIFYDQPVIKLPQDIHMETEILCALSYINSCYFLCKKGLKKSLIYHEDNFTAKLRGKIDIYKNIKHNTVKGRCDKFYCRYVDFTEDTVENRIVKAALLKCQLILTQKFLENSALKSKLKYCLNHFRRVKTVKINKKDFQMTAAGGLYSYYKPVISQARGILDLQFQSYLGQAGGLVQKNRYVNPFIINMETLFEYYARIELKKSLKSSNYRVETYSRKYYLQKGVCGIADVERGIHLMPFCVPDIVIYNGDKPAAVLDAKYKLSGKSDRLDSHQLLAYVLLTGADRCGFILPGNKTAVRKMISNGNQYLSLSPDHLRYYEVFLGNNSDNSELRKILQ